MKTKVSPAIVGAFVIGAFALGVIALLSFGGISLFSKPQRFVVYFNESIHGLDLGSPVKLRGVRVGRVVDLNVQFDEQAKRSVVRVVCEFNRNIIRNQTSEVDVTSRDVLQELIDQGLRAQLGVIGLATGLLYVELDFLDPKQYPADASTAEVKYAVVPSVLSTISEFQASITEILADVKHIDFAGLAGELRGFLADARKQVNALDLDEFVTEWTQTAKSVNAVASDPQLKETLVNLNKASIELRDLMAKLDGQIEPTGAKLGEALTDVRTTLDTFNSAAQMLGQLINAQHNLGTDAGETFVKLSKAADAVQRLADFLERNPQALLAGRKRPE
uniref:MlaD family protein n=1 Tax=Cephaloticoccus sp. TaxID=1985742 RepID=UPI00404B50E8